MDYSQKAKKTSGAPRLIDLPQATIVQIAELLLCKDLPSLICTCRDLAQMATCFYSERRSLDMGCFEKISPLLCRQIIDRFGQARLRKCSFKCDLASGSASSPSMLQAIMERFLDNYRCNEELLRDLQSSFASENSEWFAGEPTLRPMEVLTHCFLLESLLSSQPTLKEIDLDVEFGVFRVPKNRGYRQHWYLMQPFLSLQAIQRACPLLESYACSKELYQSPAVDMEHVRARFVQKNPQLRFIGIRFGLDKPSLDSYQNIKRPLQLRKAMFFLPKWRVKLEEDQRKLMGFAQKMVSLQRVALAFNSRGTLKHAVEFIGNLPSACSLLLKCEFDAGHPRFDIDEGAQAGGFFEGFSALISPRVKGLTMLEVPEGEFDMLFSPESARRCASLALLRVRFRCSGAGWGPEKESRIDEFFESSHSLLRASIVAYCGSKREQPVFCKTLSRRSSDSSMSMSRRSS